MTITVEARMVTMVTPEAREMKKTGDASSWKGFKLSQTHQTETTTKRGRRGYDR